MVQQKAETPVGTHAVAMINRRRQAMDEEELNAIEALLDTITPGEWRAYNRNCDGIEDDFLGWDVEGIPSAMRGAFAKGADAQFVARAPTNIRRLLAEVERLRAALAAMKEGE
jgi:hypothetical protein